MLENLKGEKQLIAAILTHAYNDALGDQTKIQTRSARNFLHKNNFLFSVYCELLDLDPEYAENKIQRQLTIDILFGTPHIVRPKFCKMKKCTLPDKAHAHYVSFKKERPKANVGAKLKSYLKKLSRKKIPVINIK